MAAFFPVQDAGELGWLWDIAQGGAYVLFFSGFAFAIILTFWSLVILIANFFDEAIAQRVEEARYPAMAIGTPQPFWPELRHDLGFLLKLVLYNAGLLLGSLIIFPLLAVLPFTLLMLNGYLIGLEFFTMAGGRHIGRPAAFKLAKQHRLVIFLSGLAMLLASSIPIINLAVPFWGVAMMVHLYHRLSGHYPAQEILPPSAT